jgi:hypothetical protein
VRDLRYSLLIVGLGLASITMAGCRQKNGEPKGPRVEDPPLLLEDSALSPGAGNAGEEPASPQGPVADNSRCHVCHINYADEELAVRHAQANIGCEQCHGASDAHCSDEDNVTPPDKMYPLQGINSSCIFCHSRESIDNQVHEAILSGQATEKYCTECHGEHRLSYRTRRWDKSTGELLEDDKVRMMTDEMLEQK